MMPEGSRTMGAARACGAQLAARAASSTRVHVQDGEWKCQAANGQGDARRYRLLTCGASRRRGRRGVALVGAGRAAHTIAHRIRVCRALLSYPPPQTTKIFLSPWGNPPLFCRPLLAPFKRVPARRAGHGGACRRQMLSRASGRELVGSTRLMRLTWSQTRP